MDSNTSDTALQKAGAKQWWGLAVLALPCILYAMDFTVLQLAIPDLVRDLQPTNTQLLWIMDIYGFILAGALITMGVLGDKIGRRKLLLIGAFFFGIASLGAAFAQTADQLIIARALLGLAAATLAPSTLSLIRNMFHDPKQRAFAISIWIISFSVGSAIGPLVGGALLMQYWWGSVFLIAIPVMLLLLAVGPKLLPEFKDEHAGKLDVSSALLSLGAILAVIYALKDIASHGLHISSAVLILLGMGLGYWFIRRQRSLLQPFVDLSLFSSRQFTTFLVVYTAVFFVTFASFYFISQYLQLVRDMTPLEAGLWTLPWASAFIVSSLLSQRLAQRLTSLGVMKAGLGLSILGLILLAWVSTDSPLMLYVLGLGLVSLGFGPVMSLITDNIIGSVPASKAGMASGMSETASELGGALGIALLGSLAAFVYLATVPGFVPGDSLGSALSAVNELSDASRAAKDAFVLALHWVFAASALIVAASLFCLYRLPSANHS